MAMSQDVTELLKRALALLPEAHVASPETSNFVVN
jgi:hypothetical protein